jgi:hypothetical protein
MERRDTPVPALRRLFLISIFLDFRHEGILFAPIVGFSRCLGGARGEQRQSSDEFELVTQ